MKTNLLKHFSAKLLLVWGLIFIFLPVLLLLILSLTHQQAHLGYTLSNFKVVLSMLFLRVLIRSITIALIASFICFVIAYPFAYMIAHHPKKKLLLSLVLVPFWTSSLIRCYALIGLLKARGIINSVLIKMHLINQPFDMLYNNYAVLIGLSYNLLPFAILPLYNTFEKLDLDYIDVAKDLNANFFYTVRHVIWPLSLPGVKDCFMMTFFPAMTLFYIPNILGGAKSILLGNYIENQFLLINNWPQGSAISISIILPMILMFYLLHRTKDVSKNSY